MNIIVGIFFWSSLSIGNEEHSVHVDLLMVRKISLERFVQLNF